MGTECVIGRWGICVLLEEHFWVTVDGQHGRAGTDAPPAAEIEIAGDSVA